MGLVIAYNLLWLAFVLWREHCAKQERDRHISELLEMSLDCMNRLQARGPGDYKLLSEAKSKFQKELPKPISTDEMKKRVHENAEVEAKKLFEKVANESSEFSQMRASGAGRCY